MEPHLAGLLVFMETADGMGGKFHRLADTRLERAIGGIEIGGGCRELVRLDGRLVELAREPGDRFVAFILHGFDDRAHLRLEARKVGLGAGQEALAFIGRKLGELVEIDGPGHDSFRSD